ncbi:MAG: F0F1 ATP synthase subunit epsilon [Kiritimatiellia bacterium]
MKSFKLSVRTPEKSLFEGDALYCGITTDIGSIGFKAMHEPMIAVLKNNSEVIIKDEVGNGRRLNVKDGILTFKNNTCSIAASRMISH